MKGIIVTGGTGGHIFPAISVGRAFEKAGFEIQYFIVGNKIRGRAITVPSAKEFKAGSPFSGNILIRIKNTVQLTLLFLRALFILKNADFVAGTGSYASFSLLLAAILKRIPAYMLEQNSIPGRVTRFFSARGTKTFISFPDSKEYLTGPVVFSGNPIRDEAKIKTNLKEARTSLGIRKEGKVVLVLGGSLGAYNFSKKMLEISKNFPEYFFLIQTGKHHEKLKAIFGERRDNHLLVQFHEKPGILYSAADYVVARAGASTIYELSYHEKPAIFVPFPYAQDNHQYYNALYVQNKKAGILLPESELNLETFKSAFSRLIENAEIFGKKLGEIFPHNAEQIILKEIENDMGKV